MLNILHLWWSVEIFSLLLLLLISPLIIEFWEFFKNMFQIQVFYHICDLQIFSPSLWFFSLLIVSDSQRLNFLNLVQDINQILSLPCLVPHHSGDRIQMPLLSYEPCWDLASTPSSLYHPHPTMLQLHITFCHPSNTPSSQWLQGLATHGSFPHTLSPSHLPGLSSNATSSESSPFLTTLTKL